MHFKKEVDAAKEEVKIRKRVYRRTAKKDPRSTSNQIKANAKTMSYHSTRQTVEDTVYDNNIAREWVEGRRKIRQAHYGARVGKRVGRFMGQEMAKQGRAGYGVINRTYNFVRKRGFKRTPFEERWETKLKNRVKRARKKVVKTKLGKTAQVTTKTLKLASKPLVKMVLNPLSLKSALLFFLVALISSLFMAAFSTSPIQQDEFDLNASWLQISQRDRKESDEQIDYWTNIDDVLFFMNYRYGGDWKPDSPWEEGRGGELAAKLNFNHYRDALDDIWNNLNKDSQNLKTMSDLRDRGKHHL